MFCLILIDVQTVRKHLHGRIRVSFKRLIFASLWQRIKYSSSSPNKVFQTKLYIFTSPLTVSVINVSLTSGVVHSTFSNKCCGLVLRLDPSPDFNLSQTILEKEVHPFFQSCFQRNNSEETARIKDSFGSRMAADSGKSLVIVLFVLSSAFDSVDRGIMIKSFGNLVIRGFLQTSLSEGLIFLQTCWCLSPKHILKPTGIELSNRRVLNLAMLCLCPDVPLTQLRLLKFTRRLFHFNRLKVFFFYFVKIKHVYFLFYLAVFCVVKYFIFLVKVPYKLGIFQPDHMIQDHPHHVVSAQSKLDVILIRDWILILFSL